MKTFVRWLWLGILLLPPYSAEAGSYLYYHPVTGEPLQWEPDPDGVTRVYYTVDAGGLGRLTHDQAAALLEIAMEAWEEVANIEFIPDSELLVTPEAINLENYKNYLVVGETICDDSYQEDDVVNSLQWQRKSVIGFDNTDREILDELDGLAGDGSVYGISDLTCINGTGNSPDFITSAQIVLDAASIDGDAGIVPDITVNKFFAVMVHELGHFLGLTHSSGNQGFSRALKAGDLDSKIYTPFVPTMASGTFGFYENQSLLIPDDIAAVQALYPLSNSPTSTVGGVIYKADGSPFRGAQLELRNIDDPICESFSFISGKECTPLYFSAGDILSTVAGSRCGSESINIGDFIFRAIPSGRYILEVSEVVDEYKESVIRPFSTQQPIPELPGLAEFYNTNDQAAEDPYAYSIIDVGPDTHVTGITVTLSNTVPDGDGIENVIPYTTYLDNPDFGDSLNNPNTRCKPNETNYAALIGVEELVGVSPTPPPSTPSASSASGGGGCSLGGTF